MVVLCHFIGSAIRFVAYCQPKFRPEEHPADGVYNTFPRTTRTFGRAQHPFPIAVAFDVCPTFCIQEQSQDVVQWVCHPFLFCLRFHSEHGRHRTLRIQHSHSQLGDVSVRDIRLDSRNSEATKPLQLRKLALEICLDDCFCFVCLSLSVYQSRNIRLEPAAFFL